MASLTEIKEARLKKLTHLQGAGMNPYPTRVPRTHSLSEIKDAFSALESSQTQVSITGRIMAIRGQGAIQFAVIYDGTANFQAIFKKDELNERLFDLFANCVDVGDFISATGVVFTTKRGEPSLLTQDWTMATKSLLPLPDKHHGLQDEEIRLRKRYLEIVSNPELRKLFEQKAAFWRSIRNFLETANFMEVHTPTLETTTGGAEAEPFSTHHNDYDMDVYLRISVGELWQKRLMSAGFPKTYEIGRIYRNEGTSPDHLQEFTNIEFYWAYADYEQGMEMVEAMYRQVAQETFGTTKFSTREHDFDLAHDWERLDYATTIKSMTAIDITKATSAEISDYLAKTDVKHQAHTYERLVDVLWKQCRKQLSGPAFVMGYPDFMQPLAKRDPDNPDTVQQFQVLLAGSEVGKGYSELNDPIDQRQRFEAQQKLREAGDKEAMMPDYEFLEMLEHGMPPTFGFGAGERLFAFLADKSIRETQLFPLVKPKTT